MMRESHDINSDFIVTKFEGEWLDEKNCRGTLEYKNGAHYIGAI
jgi:hypothetical protein